MLPTNDRVYRQPDLLTAWKRSGSSGIPAAPSAQERERPPGVREQLNSLGYLRDEP